MELAVRARRAGRQAVRDVAPDALRERIHALLDESAMVPGVLALSAARAVGDGDGDPGVREGGPNAGEESCETAESDGGGVAAGLDDESAPVAGANGPVGIEERAAGVQLIYEGLRLTRALADEPPWEREPPHTDSNVDVLAADVMVARGFSLLARTEAADKAVETVQSFGRDETDGQQGRAAPPHALETDVFELAMLAGTTAFGVRPADPLLAYAAELAASLGGDRPDPPEAVPEAVEQAMVDAPDPRRFVSAEDARPSATDP